MFVVNDYATAVILCIVTMLCWGSWGNTQKLAGRTWRYELFYWDYVVGMLLFSLILCFTLGSIGSEGRPFLEDLAQAAPKALGSVLLGGVIFNASNILLSASVSLAGLAVAFPHVTPANLTGKSHRTNCRCCRLKLLLRICNKICCHQSG